MDVLLPAEDAWPLPIHRAVRYSALGGGKRIRGILTLEAASLGDSEGKADGISARNVGFSKDTDVHLPAETDICSSVVARVTETQAVAAAIEMIHAYSLVHDDLPCMDDDDLRRGRPTNHRVFGEGIAVLAGDALLTRAFEVLAGLRWSTISPEISLAIVSDVARVAGASGLIGGQTADLEAEREAEESQGDQREASELLKYIHMYKTAALIRCSLRVGGYLAQLDVSQLRLIDNYGQAVGFAFQIADDLLDLFGDKELLGKATGSDERRGKLTYPVVYGVDQSKAMLEEQLHIAKENIRPFGSKARFLEQLADYIVHRDE